MLRYKTLLKNIASVYASMKDSRTVLLQQGLDEVVNAAQPQNRQDWKAVSSDTNRLLQVWIAKEKDDPASGTVAAQIMDILTELSAEDAEGTPKLVITELPDAPAPAPALVPAPPPVSAPEVKEIVFTPSDVAEDVEADEEAEEAEDEEDEDADDEEEEAEPEAEEAEESVEVPEIEAEILEPAEPEAEEAAPEPEADDGEMEVQQIHIRGKAYWLDSNSNKIYAVEGEDDVGDYCGDLVNGKPKFLAKE
jgi:hypothetical protein